AYRAAAASGSSPSGPSDGGIGCTRRPSTGTADSSASRACVSFRSGSPAGRNRSSPHHTSTFAQSTASRAGLSRSASYTAAATRPPVTTTAASPRAACASSSRVASRAATACASTPASACTTMLVSLTCPLRPWLVRLADAGVVPDVDAGGGPVVQAVGTGGGGQGGGVRLVGVEAAQFLGQVL